jgi:hypothetical protein
MIWPLLRRGILVGALAGLVAGCFAFAFGEPLVQAAIDLEITGAAHAHGHAAGSHAHVGDALISRSGQRAGLFLAALLYGACIGTVFALAFALVRGRGVPRDDWHLSMRLAAGLFVALVLVPFVKYPANPPGVGDPETIAQRTQLYLVLLAGGLVALVAAVRVAWSVRADAPPWRRPVYAVLTFAALAGLLVLALPGIDEVPAGFPASLLWDFRLSALGTQAVLWIVLGAGYGIASLRATSGAALTPTMTGPAA